jgi:DNA-binding transcriptional LysR family regulator
MDRLDLTAAFVAVAEQGSFVGAARKLARSPAAMTRAIAALDERYADQLLNRTTRVVALTDAGERYFQQAKRFLSDYVELEEAIQGEGVVSKGELTIAAPVVFGRLRVLPIVASFLAEHPAVDVDPAPLDRIVSYVDEGIDLGVEKIERVRDACQTQVDLRFALSTSTQIKHASGREIARRVSEE